MKRWLQDPAWQLIQVLIALIAIVVTVLLVPEGGQWVVETWPLAIVVLGVIVVALSLLVPSIKESICSSLLNTAQAIRRFFGASLGKLVLIGLGYLATTLVISQLLRFALPLSFDLLILITANTSIFIALGGYVVIQEINRQTAEQQTQIRAVQSELADLRQLLDNLELRPVLRKWPQFLQALSSRGDSMFAALIGAGRPASLDGSTIVVAVSVLEEAVETLNTDRLAPLLQEVFGEPYKLKFVSATRQNLLDGSKPSRDTGSTE